MGDPASTRLVDTVPELYVLGGLIAAVNVLSGVYISQSAGYGSMFTGIVVVAILGWSYWRDVTGNRLIEIDPESLFTLLGVLGGIVALVNAVLFVVFRDQSALINLGALVFVGGVLVVSLRRAQ